MERLFLCTLHLRSVPVDNPGSPPSHGNRFRSGAQLVLGVPLLDNRARSHDAFAAWRLGDPTAYQNGQVSLSPAPHVAREPIGMLVLAVLGAYAVLPLTPPGRLRDPERHTSREVRQDVSSALIETMMSMIGLLVAWQAFPTITDPLFAMILRAVYPYESYS